MCNKIMINFFNSVLKEYLSHPCFNETDTRPANPYIRPLNKKALMKVDFNAPIALNEVFAEKNLLINQILFTIYEQDMLFLNDSFRDPKGHEDFKFFYDPNFVALGKFIKPVLEASAFQFLTDEIEVIGLWNKNTFVDYLAARINDQKDKANDVCQAILNSANSPLAAKMMLIQFAPDFLSEASAMARTLTGSYGNEQSELMKVFIDEYGYGVHATKHSTLYEKTLSSVGLNPLVHYYYQDYLATSLMLTNYFHYVCSNKSAWFRYLGTIYYTEASIPHLNKQLISMLKAVFKNVDVEYFAEHIHIDMHHERMILNKVILPSIDKYGEEIIDEILFGFESCRMLQSLADEELVENIGKISLGICPEPLALKMA